jgi:uncharacterized ferredoxin-like protein
VITGEGELVAIDLIAKYNTDIGIADPKAAFIEDFVHAVVDLLQIFRERAERAAVGEEVGMENAEDADILRRTADYVRSLSGAVLQAAARAALTYGLRAGIPGI